MAALVSASFASLGAWAVLAGKNDPVAGLIIGLFAPMAIVLGQASWALLRYAKTGVRRAFLNWAAARLVFVVMGAALLVAVIVGTLLGGEPDTLVACLGGAEILVPMVMYLFGRRSKPRV